MQLLPYTRGCFVCGVQNPHGLQMKFYVETPTTSTSVLPAVHAEFTPTTVHAGIQGIIHGGILATVVDEAMFWAAALASGRFCVSAEINIRYKQRTSVGRKLLVTAEVAERTARGKPQRTSGSSVCRHHRLVETKGEIRDAATAELLVTATAKFLPLDEAAASLAVADFYPDPAAMSTSSFPELFRAQPPPSSLSQDATSREPESTHPS